MEMQVCLQLTNKAPKEKKNLPTAKHGGGSISHGAALLRLVQESLNGSQEKLNQKITKAF